MGCSLAVGILERLKLSHPRGNDGTEVGHSEAITLADGVADGVVFLGVVRLVPVTISFLDGMHRGLEVLVLRQVQFAIAINISIIPALDKYGALLSLVFLISLVLFELLQASSFLCLGSIGLPLGVLRHSPGVDELHRGLTKSDWLCFCHLCDLKVCF